MELAFTSSPFLTRPAVAERLPISTFNGRRLRVAPQRRVRFESAACLAAVNKEPNTPDSEEQLDEAAMRAADIHEVLQGLREFKNRIIDDATRLAKKVRANKKQLESSLASHPDIIKIDGHIAELEEELKSLGDR